MPEDRLLGRTIGGSLSGGERIPFKPYVYRGGQRYRGPHETAISLRPAPVDGVLRLANGEKSRAKPCGTDAAYHRHVKNDEEPCGPCTAAHGKDCSRATAARKAGESKRRRRSTDAP